MGTYYRISLLASEEAQVSKPDELRVFIEAELEALNKNFSTYIPDSIISRFNALDAGQCLVVDKYFAKVFKISKQVHIQSDGRFNPAIGKLIELWGFGSVDPNGIPDKENIEQALLASDFSALTLSDNQLCKTKSLSIDFSAIAKGYAVDVIVELLIKNGYRNLLVDIGGELQGRGYNSRGDNWTIAIEKPEKGLSRSVQKIVVLDNTGVATSGNYRNFFVHEGTSYAHTLDPRTGYPVEHDLLSATVIHPETAVADAWATALMASGAAEAIHLAIEHNLMVYLVIKPGFDEEPVAEGFWGDEVDGYLSWSSSKFQ